MKEEEKKKVLVITYYWPPSGGAGVQRWLKLTKYFEKYNLKAYVLTVDEAYASYMQIDRSFADEISSDVVVYKTKSFEPINLYASIVGKEKVPSAGFSNVNLNLKQKLVNTIRSHMFIPDPRRGWNKYAYKKAREIIKKENIDVVITSSPPHSTQLIGLRLKRELNIKWIADLRDPWTKIYYYKYLGHSFFSGWIDRRYERTVLRTADRFLTVSFNLKKEFVGLGADESKVFVLPNGYDESDFEGIVKVPNDMFTICYTGSMSDIYKPQFFFELLKEFVKSKPNVNMKFQFVGSPSEKIKKQIAEIGINVEFIPQVPHNEVVKYQKNADVLLLIIPQTENPKGLLTGKLFEYIYTGNRIICICPEDGDAASIINECGSGQAFERDKKEQMIGFLEKALSDYQQNKTFEVNNEEVKRFSRRSQVKFLRKIIDSM
jgi:glycosyltransferase involved in cell wall biosynthesis